jgi:DNA-directed RNA polymerase subunit RPC12/RpoP
MEVKCIRCLKDHSIPDSSLENKRIYFFCTQCGHKIIVHGKNSLMQNQGFLQIKEYRSLPVIKNILDAVSFSFNPFSLMMSFVFCLCVFTLLFLFAVLFIKQISFFIEYQTLSIFLSVFILSAISFGYSVLIYFISKFQMEKSETNKSELVDWDFILFDLKDDFKVILFFSVLVPLFFGMLLLPVYFLAEYGFVYAAVFSPFLFISALAVIFSLLLYNLIPSIIASESLSPIESIFNVFRFVRRELINIPFYLFTTQIVFLFIFSMILFLFGTAFLIFVSGIYYTLDPSLKTEALGVIMSLKTILMSGSQSSRELDSITAGYAVFSFFLFIVLLALASYKISLHQSLIAQSCWIMNKNREKSVPKNAMLVILTVLVVTILSIAVFINIVIMQSVHF